MINMEEMIILNRELISQYTALYVVSLSAIPFLLIFVALLRESTSTKTMEFVVDAIGIVLLLVYIYFPIAKPFHKQVERIEVIGYFEDFQKKIENRGYEVVERRGDIVVLEREYK